MEKSNVLQLLLNWVFGKLSAVRISADFSDTVKFVRRADFLLNLPNIPIFRRKY